jgi:CheY-like chemotaxis protein
MKVTDSGHGLDNEIKKQMFQPFFTTKDIGSGTGLGLAVVYGIVEKLAGRIEVVSHPGLGTTMQILLPATEELSGGEITMGSPRTPEGQGEKILVVENEEAVRNVTVRILARAGYRVTSSASGEAALLTIAQNGNPDLVLTDIVMPGMSGWELARRLEIKTLYMSGYPINEDGNDHRIVRKPFESHELLEAVAETLGHESALHS